MATDVSVSEDQLRVALTDGREIAVPLVWFPRLWDATPAQRAHWRLIGRGEGIHWPDVDEDICVAGLLRPS
ncbi:MAG TPA: DUF2442 domain-containing protein [Acetobacteraceae bacterium]|jgi:hypothetical protein